MKNIVKEFLLLTILSSYFIYCLTNSVVIKNQTILSIQLWISKIIPSLLPTFIIADLLYNSNIPYYINKYLHLNYFYLLSIICGSPTNAYILNKYEMDITKLLAVSKYTSPIFTYTFLKMIFNTKTSLIIMGANILANFILIALIKPPKIVFTYQKSNPLTVLVNSITKSINTLIVILGTIIFFNTLPINLINNIYLKTSILSILEITTALNHLSIVNLPLITKLFFTLIALSSCGLCIECQIKSIINDTSLNYGQYLKYRLGHLLIFSGLTVVLLTLLL